MVMYKIPRDDYESYVRMVYTEIAKRIAALIDKGEHPAEFDEETCVTFVQHDQLERIKSMHYDIGNDSEVLEDRELIDSIFITIKRHIDDDKPSTFVMSSLGLWKYGTEEYDIVIGFRNANHYGLTVHFGFNDEDEFECSIEVPTPDDEDIADEENTVFDGLKGVLQQISEIIKPIMRETLPIDFLMTDDT